MKEAQLRAAATLLDSDKPLLKFTIPVVIDGKPIDLIGLITFVAEDKTLLATLNFPKNYTSKFANAISGPLTRVVFSPRIEMEEYPQSQSFLHTFYSARQLAEYYALQTEGEKRALRGIVTKSFCIALRFAVEQNYMTKKSVMGVEASGDSPGNERATLADAIYVPLGFTKQKNLGYGDWYLHTTVANILQQCQSKNDQQSNWTEWFNLLSV